MTVDTPDLYGGAAVTTKNSYREAGKATFTEVAGAATFSADPGDKIEVIFGQGTDDDTAEPYGCKAIYTVPCKSNPTMSAVDLCKDGAESGVVDDSEATDLVVRVWDPEDGTTITASATVDIDNGDVFNIKTEWQAQYEEDFGNRFCDNGQGNILVIMYNTSQYTEWKATDINGVSYPSATVPSIHSVTTGYTAKGFKVPVLKSNALWTFYMVADASGSGKEPNGGQSNVTAKLYDINYYHDNDVTPPTSVCGVEDEDGNEIGAAAADTANIYVAP